MVWEEGHLLRRDGMRGGIMMFTQTVILLLIIFRSFMMSYLDFR